MCRPFGARVAVPKGTHVIELKGLHIYPGMIDSATEIGLSQIGAAFAARPALSMGTPVIELKVLHISPGMIGSATEIGLSEIGAVREMNDISDIALLKPQLRAATAVNPASEHIPVTRANGVTSVITSPGGGIIAGQSVLMHLSGWTMEDMAVRAPAAMRSEE